MSSLVYRHGDLKYQDGSYGFLQVGVRAGTRTRVLALSINHSPSDRQSENLVWLLGGEANWSISPIISSLLFLS